MQDSDHLDMYKLCQWMIFDTAEIEFLKHNEPKTLNFENDGKKYVLVTKICIKT